MSKTAYEKVAGTYDDLRAMNDGHFTDNLISEEVDRWSKETGADDKVRGDIEFNRKRSNTTHKHSGKAIAAMAGLGTVAPFLGAAGIGALNGAINPKKMTQKGPGNFVYQTLSRSSAAKEGAQRGLAKTLKGENRIKLLGLAGATAGLLGGDGIAGKMNERAKNKLGPVRDIEKSMSNRNEQWNKHLDDPLTRSRLMANLNLSMKKDEAYEKLAPSVWAQKEEENKMNKQAYDMVNETFEKVAGIKDKATDIKNKAKGFKDLVTGKALTEAKDEAKNYKKIILGGIERESADLQKAYANKKDSIRDFGNLPTKSHNEAMTQLIRKKEVPLDQKHLLNVARLENRANKNLKGYLGDANAVAKKTMGARVGLGVAGAAALGAGAYGVKKLMDKKKEKTASDMVNECFSKIAE